MSPEPRRPRSPTPGRSSRRQPAAAAGADDDLGGVDAAGEVEDRLGDVVADDVVEGAAELLDQLALARQGRRVGVGEPVGREHVHARAARRRRRGRRSGRRGGAAVSPSGPPVSATTTRSRVGQVAAMPCSRAVALEGLVDPVGQPQQRQLAQGGEVADAEVVAPARRRSCRPRRCCRAPSAGAAPRATCRPARSGRPARTTSSGTVSRCRTPVIASTTSLSDSRCWMLTVVMTSMPASSSASTSCQRFSLRRSPGTLVWASSSTSTTSGCRARTASTSISVEGGAAVGRPARAARPRGPRACAAVCGRPWVSTKPTTTSVPRSTPALALVEHRVRSCPTPGRGAEVDAQLARGHGRIVSRHRSRQPRRGGAGRG